MSVKTFPVIDLVATGDNIGDIRCLCNACLNTYRVDPDYIVKRVDPFTREKHLCDRCSGQGYNYMIIKKDSKTKNE